MRLHSFGPTVALLALSVALFVMPAPAGAQTVGGASLQAVSHNIRERPTDSFRAEHGTQLEVATEYIGEQRGDIAIFYPRVEALTTSPPPQSKLKIVCQEKVGELYTTFVGVGGNRAVIAALSRHRLKNPDKNILLNWVFVPRSQRPPAQEGTMDWAYIFDRNGDGRIDYLAYLDGPNPVVPKDWTGDLPNLGILTKQELKFFIANMRMTFWHLVDDNFDGWHDGVVVRMRDLKSRWTDSWLVARDTQFDRTYDTCQWYGEAFGWKGNNCEGSSKSYYVRGKKLGGLRLIPLTDNPFFRRINEGARECQLGSGSFYAAPEDVRAQAE